jgi:hypothetical protein
MISRKDVLMLSAIAASVALPTFAWAFPGDSDDSHAVFVMTNDADSKRSDRVRAYTVRNPIQSATIQDRRSG